MHALNSAVRPLAAAARSQRAASTAPTQLAAARRGATL
jgi:hypothetical protein